MVRAGIIVGHPLDPLSKKKDWRFLLSELHAYMLSCESQDYIQNELRIDQSESARPKAFPTIETYERHLINRIIPCWGRLAPLAVESRDVEAWFRELRKGNPQKKLKPLADPTIDKSAES